MSQRSPLSGIFKGRLRLALLLLVLAATGAQQLATLTHWHAVPTGHAIAEGPDGDTGAGTHVDCLLCRVAAHSSAAAPPPAAGLFVARVEAGLLVASYHETDVPAVPAHAWQSRGPPAT